MARAICQEWWSARWGRVIFASSESGVQIPAEMAHYGVTNTAQWAVAWGIAESFPATGVTVNPLLAGPTASEGVSTFVGDLARHHGKSRGEMERVLRASAANELAEALCDARRGRGHDRVFVQRGSFGYNGRCRRRLRGV